MVEYDFTDTVALVTGAARGQGRAHVLAFAEHGAAVVATDVCETPAESSYGLADDDDLAETVALAEQQGADALGVQMDVASAGDVERAVERAVEEFGSVDVLVNNAGIAPVSGLLELDEATWDETLAVNLKGMWLAAREVGRRLADREDGGAIVNTSSTAGLVASPGLGHYSAAKHGVVGLTKNLAIELAPHDVRVNAVCPTAVDTEMTAGIVETIDDDVAELAEQGGPDNVLGEIVEPEDVSAAVLWLASEDARFVTGVALPVAAGATAL